MDYRPLAQSIPRLDFAGKANEDLLEHHCAARFGRTSIRIVVLGYTEGLLDSLCAALRELAQYSEHRQGLPKRGSERVRLRYGWTRLAVERLADYQRARDVAG